MTLGNLVTGDCILVSKREEKSRDGKSTFYRIGIVDDLGVTGELGVSEELYRMLSKDIMFKPIKLVVTYRDSPKYGSYLVVDSIRPVTQEAKK
jgi:hypothetical protein